jgi:SAM-dependent methyltransferase
MNKHVRTFIRALLSYAAIRRMLEATPVLRAKLSPWQRTHPFDRQFGTDTSGFLPVELITSDTDLASAIFPYAGVQPSVIRRAIVALGETDEYSFVDLGCGKGRAMLVASEFPFRSVTGVELSPQLAKIARRNIARFRHRYPQRAPLTIAEANAVTWPLPEGKLVIYLYHSFGEELVSQLVKKLEAALAEGAEHMFFVYLNPVNGHLLDASPRFTRWYAANLHWDASEIGYGPDTHDAAVIWQSVGGAKATPHANAASKIVIKMPMWKAVVSP